MAEKGSTSFGEIAPENWSFSSDDGKENEPPPAKRHCLSLKKPKPRRFKAVSPRTLKKLATPNPPKNTQANTNWAMRNLTTWFEWHNRQEGAETCPDEVLSPSCSSKTLNQWLPVFVAETRNKDGKRYPPKTLYSLLTGILRSMTLENPRYPNFLEKKSVDFVDFHRSLDNIFRKLREDGIGAGSRHAPTISIEEESLLWEKGVLNDSTPRGLLRAVFYYNGKNFILRGGQEHRDLKLSQLERLTNPDRYVYTENASKNRGGGLGQLSLEHKRVPVYASVTGESKCHVRLLDKYISKLPTSAKQRDCFYLQPLSQASEDKPWFSVQPCGKNYLAKMVPSMFSEAGIEEKKTNHSLRAAGVSQLFEAGVDEKLIQSRSGHRRLESLRMYERVNANQEQAVSNILSSTERVDYWSEVERLQKSKEQTDAQQKPEECLQQPSQEVMAVNHQNSTNVPYFSGFQCYGCTVNVFQGPQ